MTRLAAPFAGSILNWRLKRGKEDPKRMQERRGIAGLERPSGALVWIHGASVGEVLSILPVVEHIRGQGFNVLVTSGTVTAAQMAAQRMPAGTLHQYVPLDSQRFVQAFLDHWRPGLALIAESEFWPNLLIETASRNIPVVLVNGRLSPRSFSRWKRAKGTAARCCRTSIFVLRRTTRSPTGSRSSARSACLRPAISNSTSRRRRRTITTCGK